MPVIDRAFIELNSNAGDVDRGFLGLIRTLAGANEAVKSQQEKVLALSNANSVLIGQTERLEAKHEALVKSLNSGKLGTEEMTKARKDESRMISQLDKLEEKTIQNKEALAKAQVKLDAATHKNSDTFKAFGSVLTNFLTHPLDTAQAGMGTLLERMGPTAVAIGGIATAAVAAGAGLFTFAANAAKSAEALRNMSTITGLTTQQLQALQEIQKEAGLEGLHLARSLGIINQEMAGGKMPMTGTDLVGVLNALRIANKESAADLRGGVLPLLDDLQKHLLGISDPAQRAELANKAFGKRLQEMIPLILNSTVSLTDQISAMEKAGVVWDDAAQNKLKRLDERIDILRRGWSAVALATQAAAGSLVDYAMRFVELPGDAKSAVAAADEALLKRGGKLDFPKSPFAHIMETMSPLDVMEQRIAAAKAIASGDRLDLNLKIQIAEKEKEFAMSASMNDVIQAEALAKDIAGLKQKLKLQEAIRKEQEALQRFRLDVQTGRGGFVNEELQASEEAKRAQSTEDFMRTLRGGELASSEAITKDREFRLKIEAATAKDISDSRLRELNIEMKIAGEIVGRTAKERIALAEKKASIEFELRSEEVIVKYRQKLLEIQTEYDAMKDKSIFTEEAFLRRKAELETAQANEIADLRKLKEAEVVKEQKKEQISFLNSIEQSAGSLFDAITARGKGAFQSLADWVEGIFLSMAKKIFTNLVSAIFTGQAPAGGIFGGIFGGGIGGSSPNVGNAAGTGFSGGLFGTISNLFRGGSGVSSISGTNAATIAQAGGMSSVATGIFTPSGGSVMTPAGSSFLGVGGKAGAGLQAGAMIGGQLLLGDAWKQGGARGILEGIGGGAAMGASIGAMAGPIGAGIGAAIGAAAGLIIGMFGGGEKRRIGQLYLIFIKRIENQIQRLRHERDIIGFCSLPRRLNVRINCRIPI